MIIATATALDVDGLISVENTCFTTDQLHRRNFMHLLKSKAALVLAAKAQNTVIGSAVVFYRKHSKTARLYSLAVHPDHRKHGVALALMQTLEMDALRHGCTRMKLEVRCDNARAIGFYERGGYLKTGEISGFYEDGQTAWCMEKPLKTNETAAS
ncbi:MAG TPA: GNAT family N-acetyltransferase [Gammaproteobacteria bacterium]|jgi:ribosomal-protein-alanine N-acetyltransferase|nr:GNAT family N-acetyltransferase [Gammaproteobacteria bacterium]